MLSLVAFLLCVGTAAAEEEPEVGADTTPPIFANGQLSPSYLPYEGGNSQISVDIIDETELHSTYAQVFGSDGSYQSIYLYQGNGSTYYGTLEAAANYSDGTVTYLVEVQASDAFHNYNAAYLGEVQVEPAPQFDESPWISQTSLNPQFLPSSGGTVTITAEAGDNRALSAIYAIVTPVNGGASINVGLNGVSGSSFEGTYEAPANTATLAAEYLVEVVVEDDVGQQGRASAGTITVDAPEVAPPPSPCKGKPHRPASLPAGPKGCGTVGKSAR
ncbi:MAG TPA: hypothetical protein VFU11_03195 [Solirubrobacterales bacterium]|nr:hypothetical protein [Solirubrobacterales bacterium]